MEDNQLKLLEERIGNAIDFIERLKSREKVHIQDKEGLEERIASLEEQIKEKEGTIKELKDSQVFLKEKIEVILGKLESWADMVDVAGYDLDSASVPEADSFEARIDVEETENMLGEPAIEQGEEDSDTEQVDSKKDPASSLFDGDDEYSTDQSSEDEWPEEQESSQESSDDDLKDTDSSNES
jgi:uncharacterized coiled-coil protein SlyX